MFCYTFSVNLLITHRAANVGADLMKESEFAQLIQTQLAGEPFSVDGVLQKWVVIGKAQNGDSELIKRLLTSADLKKAFFKEVAADAADVALVFDQQKFVRYLEMKNYLKDSYTEYTNKVGLQNVGGGG